MPAQVIAPARWGTRTALSFALLVGCTATQPHTRVAAVTHAALTPPAPARPEAPPGVARGLRPVRLQSCAAERGAHATNRPTVEGNPNARRGAQRGLEFVAREAIAWQGQHNCYGCHVQAVTFEALTVGRERQYDVSSEQFAEVLRGLTTINGGSRGTNGLSVGNDPRHLIETSRAFGGAAFARYDATLGAELRDDLLEAAAQIKGYQNDDGSVRTTDTRFPVVAGLMQATTQAMQTWHQAHTRTADEQWLEPVRRAEAWMQTQARRLSDDPDATQVDINYAVMGLREAGAQPGEAALRALEGRIRTRQNDDGGWSYQARGASNAFATGQTLYALRTLGASDGDAVVARGTAWLLAHQADDGGWSHTGTGKAEAMWAVFGLVSLDVLSVDVAGLRDGQHASGTVSVQARAVDNSGAAVERVDVLVDDVPLARNCGATLTHAVDLGALDAGVHTLEVVAANARGQSSRRRVEFYTGDHYLTHVGSRFEGGATAFSWRNVAPEGTRGEVTLRVFATREEHGVTARDREVFHAAQAAAQGPMRATWDGHGADGAQLPNGRYVAEVSFAGAGGRAVQRVEVPFVHDTPEAQRAAFAEVEGSLQGEGGASASNAEVELVDRLGNVVQRATTTAQGNFRFRNVNGGEYRVRARRQGFSPTETSVRAAAGRASSAAPMAMDLAY
jgi:squalene-hopene/tetraprenyl-beta-curcumene cyclase